MTFAPRLLATVALLLAAAPAMAQAPLAVPAANQTGDAYWTGGQAALKAALARRPNTGRAKNIILFVGDGMGISTVTASRIWEGQTRDVDGESNSLSFERLPYVALSKTYAADFQVPDSAATATAMMTGVKTNLRVLGVGPQARSEDCASAAGAALVTLAEMARARGKTAGAVTTTRITHATPAATYAHTAFRDWEADSDMPPEAREQGCVDIARQLVEAPERLRLNVAMGGGRGRFLPDGAGGRRGDDRDLTAAWAAAPRSAYVADSAAMAALKPGAQDHVLGLFGVEHLPYEADRALLGEGVPTLAEMTAKAIDLLSTDRDGFFLMVEGGKIDQANHLNNAYRAVTETTAFADAVAVALTKVALKDTLIVVTADHSHGLVINGYAARNAPILGIAGDEGRAVLAADGKPYTTLTYATGPGGPEGANLRGDPRESDLEDVDYRQQSTAHLSSSAHSGEDVGVWAGGPQAHLLSGVMEQSYIFHVMRHAFGF